MIFVKDIYLTLYQVLVSVLHWLCENNLKVFFLVLYSTEF